MLAAACQGDPQAFNKLVLIYQHQVYNLAYRILADTEAAADASQEAFLAAFRNMGRFRGGSFRAWLLRIVTNACYDQLRRKQRRPTSPLEPLLGDPDRVAVLTDPGESPENHALRRELNQILQAGIRTLPPDQRVTLVLADVEGISYQEIAAITQVPLGTVKSRLSRGRAKLRDYLLEKKELLPARYRLTDERSVE